MPSAIKAWKNSKLSHTLEPLIPNQSDATVAFRGQYHHAGLRFVSLQLMMQIINADDHNDHLLLEKCLFFPSSTLSTRFMLYNSKTCFGKLYISTSSRSVAAGSYKEFLISGALPSQGEEIWLDIKNLRRFYTLRILI